MKSMIKKLAIITTHPVQYNVPLFQILHSNKKIEIKVFYTWGDDVLIKKFDPGFNINVDWDLPMIQNYSCQFCLNIAKNKGSHHFFGIDNPYLFDNLKDYSPDGILLFGWRFKSHLNVLRHFKGKIPIMFRGDSTLVDNKGFFKNKLRLLFLKWIYRNVDIALFTGKNNYDYFIASGLKSSQLIFAPHAVDNVRFGNLSNEIKEFSFKIKESLSILSEDFVFLYTGKFEPKKDLLFLIEAFKNAALGNKVHLILAGSGIQENEIKHSVRNCKNIHVIGFINQLNIPAIYEMADVFVLPSKGPNETWGLSVNEAMANGKAVMVSNKCGCAIDLVKGNGYVFESGNSLDLISKLKFICSDRNNVEKLKLNSKNIIQSYSLENLASVIESVVIGL
jgi:glycosyltransferase involved in cell wall biosynthesis